MNGNFKLADGVPASQVANRFPGQKYDHSCVPGRIAQDAQGVLLIVREPVFQEVNVIGHSESPLSASGCAAKCLIRNRLGANEHSCKAVPYHNLPLLARRLRGE